MLPITTNGISDGLKKKKCYGDNGRIAPGDCAGSTK